MKSFNALVEMEHLFSEIKKSPLDFKGAWNKTLVLCVRVSTFAAENEDKVRTNHFYQCLMTLLTHFELNSSTSMEQILEELSLDVLDEYTVQQLIARREAWFTTALSQELNPLSLLSLLENEASRPLVFVALILSLLKRGIDAASLLQSGLFHRYYIAHTDTPEDVSSVYSLLGKYDATRKLLEQACMIQAPEIRGLGRRALSGDVLTIPAVELQPAPPLAATGFSVTATEANLTQLLTYFGQAFLVPLLLTSSSNEINRWLIKTIRAMSVDVLDLFYKKTLSCVAAEQRTRVLAYLGQYLSPLQAQSLVNTSSGQGILWVLAAINPLLLDGMTQVQLDLWVQSNMITLGTMSYAFNCLKHKRLNSYHERVHQGIFTCLLENPKVYISDEIKASFNEYKMTVSWCQEAHKNLWSKLQKDILSGIPLNSHQLVTIRDSYHCKLYQWKMLEQLSPSVIDYPRDIYSLHSLIIKALYEHNYFDTTCLDVLHPQDAYIDYENSTQLTINAKKRTLLTCLVEQNDVDLQERLITLLASECATTDWITSKINQVSLLEKAITCENEAFLNRYFSGGKSAPFEVVGKRLNKGVGKLLHKARIYPLSLKAILSFVPEHMRLAALLEQDKNERTVLYYASSHLACLSIILALLPKHDCFAAITVKNDAGDNLFHKAIVHPVLLEILLTYLADEPFFNAIKERDIHGETVLHVASMRPIVLTSILSHVSANRRCDAIKEKNAFGQTVLHSASESPESLNVLLSFLSEDERLDVVLEPNYLGETVLDLAVNSPASLEVIYSFLPKHTLESKRAASPNRASFFSISMESEAEHRLDLEAHRSKRYKSETEGTNNRGPSPSYAEFISRLK